MRSLLHALLLICLLVPGIPLRASTAHPEEIRFPVGEQLVYRVYWGRIPVGESVVTTAWRELDGRTVLAVRMRTRSNRVLRTVYPVDDTIESLICPATLLPLRFTKRLRAGRRRVHEISDFDHPNGTLHWRSLTRDREREIDIEPDTRGLLSFMYYMRNVSLEAHRNLEFRVMADDKIYDLFVAVYPPETVRLRGGARVSSFRLYPEAAFEGLFVREGEAWMWVADDDRRLAVKITVDIPIARVHALLDEIRDTGRYVRIGPDAAPVEGDRFFSDREEEEEDS